MLFFEEQERARKRTKWLVISFLTAVMCVVLILIAGVEVMFKVSEPKINPSVHSALQKLDVNEAQKYEKKIQEHQRLKKAVQVIVLVSATMTMLSCAIYQIIVLKSGGGKRVAQMVGARKIDGSSKDPLERRYLNVVEEMAIASGIPKPACYVLDNEPSINAFAAGWGLEDAVICVNQGTLNYLSRDELQGVIAHEISHIVNADMKINIRVIAVIFGLAGLMIIGKWILEVASRIKGEKSAGIMLMGFATGILFIAAGFLGSIAGNIISAAISRQREYLADAAAVQFTRNPDSIGGALRKIKTMMKQGDGYMKGAKTLSVSHMCLSPAVKKLSESMFATHPSLEHRISRIYGGKVLAGLPLESESLKAAKEVQERINEERNVDNNILSSEAVLGMSLIPKSQAAIKSSLMKEGISETGAGSGVVSTIEDVGYSVHAKAQHVMSFIGKGLIEASETTKDSVYLVLALMRKSNTDEDKKKMDELIRKQENELGLIRIRQLEKELKTVPEPLHLALVDLSVSSLMDLGKPEKTQLHKLLVQLAKIDGKVRVYEMALLEIIDRKLLKTGFELSKNKKGKLVDHKESIAKVIAWIAKMSWAERAQDYYEKAAKEPGIMNVLKNVPWEDAAKGGISQKDLKVLEELAMMQRPLVIKLILSVMNTEKTQSLDALRLCCTIMNVPIPMSGLEINA